MRPYELLFKHLLRRLDAESAHRLGMSALAFTARFPPVLGLMRRALAPRDPVLRVQAFGLSFASPLGVPAGMDKEVTAFEGLNALGFGFVEIGTITAVPQQGNPRPRVHRLIEDRGLLNAMGFPNPGAKLAAQHLARRGPRGIVAVNVGKSKVAPLDEAAADYRATVSQLAPLADFIVLNVSSPNTPGLRELQTVEHLGELLDAVEAELAALHLSKPVLIKIAPDLGDDELDAVADFAVARKVGGLIATNTTISRDGLTTDPGLPGGVSGAPLKARSLEVLRRLYARVGDELPLVSVGGIETAQDAWDRILAGATLVQGYTGFVYGGPLWPKRLNDELARRAHTAGATSIQALVGAEHRLEASIAA
ncbi:quinone-dependent dihydroorotate dehydrogenase [Solirubrobacter ginsenosidimutans]|uniref:Dihydroorotate dehydrogenase (quinone) n=1 Tax=Solirubrobacter ginsenosidimutans TaxID=490573 RepID=A0A9X3MRX8_9ACTN|nr:quinone-dependent dihydroorotate dehydrogenase [Solirubrobacter ginsenosidimutans]MDA0161901.1 quinone-dependent dihydroorotate dehydrogenase [Solirubrobacter ginsenosidimutans]